ncbi:MAG: ATP-binding cassette domain-containing protein [Armatimonadetes bacterium]|nr:ATP-binding cassette domain-containing protein [Armatimonadota bacterium]MDE2206749.1 ATP-binding cassette domain-containing protein [Armatimonadota bacterium]
MIRFEGVSRKFGAVRALDQVSLEVQTGRTTALIGPSGCGKSTLLKLVLRLLAPTEGRILLDGKPIEATPAADLRRRIGYVTQDGGLFPHLTARRNVTLMAHHLQMDAESAALRVSELCRLTRFPESALDRYPLEISGGQRQRVALMRALMLKPELLLLDEPLAALDPMVRAGLQTDLKAIFGELATVVFVTHDMAEAAYLGDEIVLLRDGRLVMNGSLEDLCLRPADGFVTEFLAAQRGFQMPMEASR